MEFRTLDKTFEFVGIITPINLQWNRKYYELGNFVITIPIAQYHSNVRYISCNERDELGVVNKVSYSKTNGTVEISGYFAESLLNFGDTYPTFYGSGEITSVLKTMIETYQVDVDNLWRVYDIVALETGEKVDFQSTGDELATKLYELLKTQQMSFRLVYDFEQAHIKVEFYKGKDMTQNANGDTFVSFTTAKGNIVDPIVYIDDSNYKNFAVVAGSGEADERIFVEVDQRQEGEGTRKLFVDERNTQFNSSEQTLDQYKLELQQKGIEKLQEYQKITNVDFSVYSGGYQYMKDFDIGTKCDIIIENVGLSIEARIIAIYEAFQNGKHTIEIEVGDKVPTSYDKVRR